MASLAAAGALAWAHDQSSLVVARAFRKRVFLFIFYFSHVSCLIDRPGKWFETQKSLKRSLLRLSRQLLY